MLSPSPRPEGGRHQGQRNRPHRERCRFRHRIEPAVILAAQGGLDYLVLESLGERTIALAQLKRLRDPGEGYDPLLDARRSALLPLPKRNHVRLVTNMGQANPRGAGERAVAVARRLGVPVKVAVVSGDDVLDRLDPEARVLESGRPLKELGGIVSANAYLGAEALLPALASGAEVVITGRVADPCCSWCRSPAGSAGASPTPRSWRAARSSDTRSSARGS